MSVTTNSPFRDSFHPDDQIPSKHKIIGLRSYKNITTKSISRRYCYGNWMAISSYMFGMGRSKYKTSVNWLYNPFVKFIAMKAS